MLHDAPNIHFYLPIFKKYQVTLKTIVYKILGGFVILFLCNLGHEELI